MPDISKWNAIIPEIKISSSLNSNSISIKEIKSDSIFEEEIIENINSSKNSSPSESDKYNYSVKNIIYTSNDENLDDYYDNFYE